MSHMPSHFLYEIGATIMWELQEICKITNIPYCTDPKFSDRQVDKQNKHQEQSDLGLP